ncbi:MAG: hypothetical protein LUD78_05055 [Clostridiales bacterium]|nr:hypothetical protein [Clostridiales bacterium]
MQTLLRIENRVWEEALLDEGEPAALCRCTLPEVSRLEGRAQTRMNRFYRHGEERFRRWCRTALLRRAAAQRREARAVSHSFDPWEVSLTCEAGEPEGETLAVTLLYRRKQGGRVLYADRQTIRWNLKNGYPIYPI